MRQTEETEIEEGGDGEGDKLPINSFHYPVAAAEYSSVIDSLSITAPTPSFFSLSIPHLNVSIRPYLSFPPLPSSVRLVLILTLEEEKGVIYSR